MNKISILKTSETLKKFKKKYHIKSNVELAKILKMDRPRTSKLVNGTQPNFIRQTTYEKIEEKLANYIAKKEKENE